MVWLAALHDAQLPATDPIIVSRSELGADDFDPELFILPAVCIEEHMTEERLRKLKLFLVDVEHKFQAEGGNEPSVDIPTTGEKKLPIDQTPDYPKLVADEPGLAAILIGNHEEAVACFKAKAYTACTVLLGSILEGCLAYLAKTSLVSKHDGCTYEKCTLGPLLDLAKKHNWIGNSFVGFPNVLHNCRNLIHPYKRLGAKIDLDVHSCMFCFTVLNATIQQLNKTRQERLPASQMPDSM